MYAATIEERAIRSPDGASVRARVFSPRRDEPAKPVGLLLPAMGARASFYEPLALALAEQGMPAVTVDLRGQGGSSERASRGARFGYREIVEVDLPAQAAFVEARFPGRALLVIGHSLGGQLAALALASGRLRADGLVLVASGSAHWRAWPRRGKRRALLLVSAVALAARLLPWYPGRRLGFGGDQPRALMRDWTRNAFTGRYPFVTTRPHAGTPVLSVEIAGDPIAPPGAASALLRLFHAERVVRETIPTTSGSPWKSHFDWVRAPERVVSSIQAWMISGRASLGYRFLRRERRAG